MNLLIFFKMEKKIIFILYKLLVIYWYKLKVNLYYCRISILIYFVLYV